MLLSAERLPNGDTQLNHKRVQARALVEHLQAVRDLHGIPDIMCLLIVERNHGGIGGADTINEIYQIQIEDGREYNIAALCLKERDGLSYGTYTTEERKRKMAVGFAALVEEGDRGLLFHRKFYTSARSQVHERALGATSGDRGLAMALIMVAELVGFSYRNKPSRKRDDTGKPRFDRFYGGKNMGTEKVDDLVMALMMLWFWCCYSMNNRDKVDYWEITSRTGPNLAMPGIAPSMRRLALNH